MWTLSTALDGSRGEEAEQLGCQSPAFPDKADTKEALTFLAPNKQRHLFNHLEEVEGSTQPWKEF